jgi:signal transduction histidine kinase/PAS domain-containing protein
MIIIENTMTDLLLKETTQLLNEVADVDLLYYFHKDNILYNLENKKLKEADYTYQEFLDSFHPSDSLLFDSSFSSILSGASNYSNKVYRKKQHAHDEHYQLYNINIISHRDNNDEIDFVMFSIKNITDIASTHRKQSIMLDKYQTIFSNLPFATICFDDSGRVLQANSNAVSMSKNWFGTELFSVNFLNAKGVDDDMRKHFSEHIPFTRDVRCKINYDEYRDVRTNYVPISDDDGNFLGHMMLFDDITSEKQLLRSNDMFTKKMKMVTEHFGLIHLDYFPYTRTLNVDGGYSLAHIDNVPIEHIYDMIHPDDLSIIEDAVENFAYLPMKPYEINFRMLMSNHDDYRNVTLSLIPRLDNNIRLKCYTGLMEDITDRVRQLEEKELTLRKLQHAIDKAEESDRLKSSFLANISHEIRTPLNAIVGFSELIVSEEDTEKREEFCNIIRNNTATLLELVGGILDLSKLESGNTDFDNEEFDVDNFIQDLYYSFKYRFPENNELDFILDLGAPCTIVADVDRVREVLTNFLTNAIKYTSKGNIKLKYSFDGTNVRMEVSDTGIGISSEGIEKVFNRFEKLGCLLPGSGLGLTICKNIMNILKGDIGVTSTIGEGSTFWISLPAKPVC